MQKNLSNITIGDLAGAKSNEFSGYAVCPDGEHVFKILEFVETDTYRQVKVQEGTNKYSFFYDYYLRDSDVLDADVLNWMKSLATILVEANTNFREIANSAIGCSYKITTRSYVGKSGKNAGKTVSVIDFKKLPERVIIDDVTTIEGADELPF